MLLEELARLATSDTLVTIELDDADESEVTGFIRSATAGLVQVQQVGDDGRTEGHTVFEPAMVNEVWWNDSELEAIGRLAAERNTLVRVALAASSLHDAVVELSRRYPAIALYRTAHPSGYVVAKVGAHDDEWLKLDCFGPRRMMKMYKKLMKLDAVSRVEFDTPYIADIIALHDG